MFSGHALRAAARDEPATTTSTTAACGRGGEREPALRAPNVTTMKTTSSPSSNTPLKATVNEYQSIPRRCSAPAAAACSRSARERRVLVVQRLVAARAQNRLAQPLQTEDEQQRADDEAERLDREQRERGAEHGDDHRQHDRRGTTPIRGERQPRTTPTASTIVSASTISTPLARNAARKRKMSWVTTPIVGTDGGHAVPRYRVAATLRGL